MKKILFSIFVSLAFLSGCGLGDDAKNSGKIKLEFNPEKGKTVRINYTFSVNSLANGDISTFEMLISGKAEKTEDGSSVMELRNDHISMTGMIQGVTVKGSAGGLGDDSIQGDASLIAMPVFAFHGKTYRSALAPTLDKKWEVQLNGETIVDSSENKMQLLLRYPGKDVQVGDTWTKTLLIKSGNKMNCAATYTLKEIKGDTAIVSIEGKLDGKGESFGNEFTIDGKLTGNFTVNISTGWPVDSDLNEEFTLKMGGKDLPMKYSMKTRVE